MRIKRLKRVCGGVSAHLVRRYSSLGQEFACFSYDESHDFHLDDSSLKYYYTPQMGADLSKGFDTFQKQDDGGDEHLDGLLKTIAAHELEIGKRIDANIVTWRGMITKVILTRRDLSNFHF